MMELFWFIENIISTFVAHYLATRWITRGERVSLLTLTSYQTERWFLLTLYFHTSSKFVCQILYSFNNDFLLLVFNVYFLFNLFVHNLYIQILIFLLKLRNINWFSLTSHFDYFIGYFLDLIVNYIILFSFFCFKIYNILNVFFR